MTHYYPEALKNLFANFGKFFSLNRSCLVHDWDKWVSAAPASTSSAMYKYGLVATHEQKCRRCHTIQLRVAKVDVQ